MEKTIREFKGFRIQKQYLDMLEEIVNYQNSLPEFKEANLEVGERHVVEEAIQHYHAQIFGDKVMSFAIPQIAEHLANKIDVKFDRFLESMAQVLNNLLLTENVNKELLGIMLRKNGFDIDLIKDGRTNTLVELAQENEFLYSAIESIIIDKNDL